MAVIVYVLVFDSVGLHGMRKFEFYELREQVCISLLWEVTCVVSLIGA